MATPVVNSIDSSLFLFSIHTEIKTRGDDGGGGGKGDTREEKRETNLKLNNEFIIRSRQGVKQRMGARMTGLGTKNIYSK